MIHSCSNSLLLIVEAQQVDTDVLNYLCTVSVNGKSKAFHYGPSWTECLRLIRNVNQHWKDRPRPLPQPEVFYVVDDPQEYFLKIFPDLPVVVHRIVRSCIWKERQNLKKFFIKGMFTHYFSLCQPCQRLAMHFYNLHYSTAILLHVRTRQ